MALRSQSLLLFGYSVTVTNQNLDFKAVNGGPTLTAVIPLGSYSLTTLMAAIAIALADADMTSGALYSVTADRSIMGGTQNRVIISSSGSFFQLLFGSGPHASTSISSIIGFSLVDRTGSTSYVGTSTTGNALIPKYIGYNYADINQQARLFGAVNISASGLKESVVFNSQFFFDVEFKYEAKADLPAWVGFRNWAITQAPFDFTPEISDPNTSFPVTLEKSQYGQNGMGFLMKEMLPDFPNFYTTGPLNFRLVLDFTTTVFVS